MSTYKRSTKPWPALEAIAEKQDERRYTFGTRGLELLEDLEKSFKSQEYTTRREFETFKGFDLHTLVVFPPKRTPVKFTPAREQ